MPGKYHDWQELLLFQVYGYASKLPRLTGTFTLSGIWLRQGNTMTDMDYLVFTISGIWLCQGNTMTDRNYLLFQV